MKRTFILVLLSLLGLAQGLQRLRHRRVSGPDPDPVVLGSGFVDRAQREDQESNLHKPIFTQCEFYDPEVFEEEPQGKNILPIRVPLSMVVEVVAYCCPASPLDWHLGSLRHFDTRLKIDTFYRVIVQLFAHHSPLVTRPSHAKKKGMNSEKEILQAKIVKEEKKSLTFIWWIWENPLYSEELLHHQDDLVDTFIFCERNSGHGTEEEELTVESSWNKFLRVSHSST